MYLQCTRSVHHPLPPVLVGWITWLWCVGNVLFILRVVPNPYSIHTCQGHSHPVPPRRQLWTGVHRNGLIYKANWPRQLSPHTILDRWARVGSLSQTQLVQLQSGYYVKLRGGPERALQAINGSRRSLDEWEESRENAKGSLRLIKSQGAWSARQQERGDFWDIKAKERTLQEDLSTYILREQWCDKVTDLLMDQ